MLDQSIHSIGIIFYITYIWFKIFSLQPSEKDTNTPKSSEYLKNGLILSSTIAGDIQFHRPIEIIFDFTEKVRI